MFLALNVLDEIVLLARRIPTPDGGFLIGIG